MEGFRRDHKVPEPGPTTKVTLYQGSQTSRVQTQGTADGGSGSMVPTKDTSVAYCRGECSTGVLYGHTVDVTEEGTDS